MYFLTFHAFTGPMVSDVGTGFCFFIFFKLILKGELYPDMIFANKSPCELPLASLSAHLVVSSNLCSD